MKSHTYENHVVRIQALPEQRSLFEANGWVEEPTTEGLLLFRNMFLLPNVPATHPMNPWILFQKLPQVSEIAIFPATVGKKSYPASFESLKTMESSFTEPLWMESLMRIWMFPKLYSVNSSKIYVKVSGRKSHLRLYSRMCGSTFSEYVDYLENLRASRFYTPTKFNLSAFPKNRYPIAPDVWWDVNNDVIFTFNRDFTLKLPELLARAATAAFGSLQNGNLS